MMTKMDGFDDCIVGVVEQYGRPSVLCYSVEKVIKQLMADGMTEEEAVDYHQFNQACAYVGETTPTFLHPYNNEENE